MKQHSPALMLLLYELVIALYSGSKFEARARGSSGRMLRTSTGAVVDAGRVHRLFEATEELYNLHWVFHGVESDFVWLVHNFNRATHLFICLCHGLPIPELDTDFSPDMRYQLFNWCIRPLPTYMIRPFVYDCVCNAWLNRALGRSGPLNLEVLNAEGEAVNAAVYDKSWRLRTLAHRASADTPALLAWFGIKYPPVVRRRARGRTRTAMRALAESGATGKSKIEVDAVTKEGEERVLARLEAARTNPGGGTRVGPLPTLGVQSSNPAEEAASAEPELAVVTAAHACISVSQRAAPIQSPVVQVGMAGAGARMRERQRLANKKSDSTQAAEAGERGKMVEEVFEYASTPNL
ncbi:hypothetical protein PENSPDRAFT_669105 [Peniophora sp. CONT]|nr:hypothetical protein PENSPDRAFT_669105 [Peniophora sp. CONT]